MIFASPVPKAYVDGSFYEDAGRPFYLSPEKLAGDFSPVRFRRELKLFRKFCAGGDVLDVGCSTGAFLHQLGRHYPREYRLAGTDVSGPALDHAESQGIEVIRGNFLSTDFALRNLDAITFWAVLEHVAGPRRFLEQAFRLLKPGGLCFVLVPNWNSLARRLLGSRYRYILGQHLNYFTARTLRQTAPPGLEIIHTAFTHFNPIVILQDFRRNADPSPSDRVELLQKTNKLKVSILQYPYAVAERLLSLLHLTDNLVMAFRRGLDSGAA